MKKRIDLKLLKKDIPTMSDEKIDEIGNVFLIYSFDCHTNPFHIDDCRKAINMCIREMKKRGYDEEELTW
jgi:hypothetical protein